MPHFDALKIYIAVENNVRQGEIAWNKQFLLFSQCFLPYVAFIFHFKCTLKCRLQFVSILTSLNFVVWKRVRIIICIFSTLSRRNLYLYFSTRQFNSRLHCIGHASLMLAGNIISTSYG